LRAFAVAHLKMGHGATKRRDLGKSSRGEKKLQDIIEVARRIVVVSKESKPRISRITRIRNGTTSFFPSVLSA
ncbi:MAG: hypothetical protein ABSD28_08260, partial [Tepidisphaeraceae bacterium]